MHYNAFSTEKGREPTFNGMRAKEVKGRGNGRDLVSALKTPINTLCSQSCDKEAYSSRAYGLSFPMLEAVMNSNSSSSSSSSSLVLI